MRVARHKQNHAHVARGHVLFQARAPALITLPISLPSIPLLGPLITPLIAGTNFNQPATSPSTPTPTPAAPAQGTTPAPAPSPIPTGTPASVPAPAPTPEPTSPATDNGGNNSEDNGRSNDGFSSISRSLDKNTSLVTVGSSTSFGHRISTGSLPHPSETSGNASTGGNESGDGASGDGTPSSSPASGSNLNGSLAGVAADVHSAGGAKSPGKGSIIGGNTDTAVSEATASSMNDFPGSTALPSASNTRNPASNDVGHGLSGGVIAGMVIVIAFGVLALIVILLRGGYRRRRSERRNHWWNRSGTRFSTESDSTAVAGPSDRVSFRSSFETTIDHAQAPRLDVSLDDVPSLPPMAEIRGSDNIQLFTPYQDRSDSPMLITFDNSQPPTPNNRASIHSLTSGSHYLVVPSGPERDTSSPVSVRPFSPSESFSFPMPPKTQSGDWSSSRPMSNSTLHGAPRTAVIPALPPDTLAGPSNPFSDPVSPPTAEFVQVNSIQRPYEGTRHDELTVTSADSVKVLRLFDDDWALVEKLPAFEDILANEGKNARGTQGLIPIDCFLSAGQDLSSFSKKRISSALYKGPTNSICAVMAK